MKNKAFFLILLFLAGCYDRPVTKTGLEGKAIPSFNLLLADSTTQINTSSIPSGHPVVLCYFGTHCPYSRAEMEAILKDINELKDIRFYILTSDPFPYMKGFYTHYQLKKYDNITLGLDYARFFGNYFQAQGVPYMAVYNKEKKLNRVFIGKTDIALIKNIAEN